MRGVLAGAILAAVGLLPLAFGGVRPVAWSLYGVAVGVLLLIGSGYRIRSPEPVRREERVGLAVLVCGHLLLAGWMGVQVAGWTPDAWHHPVWSLTGEHFGGVAAAPGAISVAPEETMAALTRWLAYGATFLLVCGVARQRTTAWLLVKGVALIGLAYAIYGLVVQFGGYNTILWFDKWAYRDVLTSTFVNRNSYATFGGLAALCWLAWLLHASPSVPPTLPRRERMLRHAQSLSGPLVLIWTGLVVVVTSVLLTQSRAGIAAMILGIMLLLGGYTLSKGLSLRRVAGPLAVVALVGGVAMLSADGVLLRLSEQGLDDSMRDAAAAIMVRATADAPWTGFGWGAFEPAFNLYRDASLVGRFDRGHNDVLETVFKLGIPAALILFSLIAVVAAVHARGLWSRRRDRQLPGLGLAATGLVVFHAFFDFSLQMPAVAALYLCIAAAAWAQSFSSRTADARA